VETFRFAAWGCWSAQAKLAHEILHIIVHRKVDQLTFLIECLFELIFYVDRITIAGHIPLRSLQRAGKGSLAADARNDLIALHVVFNRGTCEVRHGSDKPFGELDETVHTAEFLTSRPIRDDNVCIGYILGFLAKAAVIVQIYRILSEIRDIHFRLLSSELTITALLGGLMHFHFTFQPGSIYYFIMRLKTLSEGS
jgi:hypothetical protein